MENDQAYSHQHSLKNAEFLSQWSPGEWKPWGM
jgi:hypothetical protein